MRSTRVSSWARLVITAETCGISDMPAKVAPPLKSTSTMLSCSGECVIARPSTRVRRNSDLPEPVAPITRPCGPMPCWADSLMSRWTSEPPSPRPIGTRSRSRAGRGRQARSGSKECTSPRASSSMKSTRSGDLAAGRVDDAGRDRVQRGQPPREGLRGRDRALVDAGPDRLLAQPQREHRVAAVGGRLAVELEPQPARVLELVPARPGGRAGSRRAGRRAVRRGCRAAARRRRSRAGCEGWRAARRRRTGAARSGRAGAARPARPATSTPSASGPTASDCWALWACGSHFTQSQCARFCSEESTATTRCSGEWKAVAEQISDAGQGAGRLLGSADLEPVEGAQVDRRGQVGLQPVDDQQPVQGRGRGRVDLVDRRALGRDQLERERLGAHAVAHVEEAGIARAVLPDPGPLLGQGGQRATGRGGAR